MAQVVGAFFMPHDPLIFINPRKMDQQHILEAYSQIRDRIRELGATTAIVFGADHYILFGPSCLPQISIAVGDVHGPIDQLPGLRDEIIPNNEGLAHHIMEYGFENGFDWAVSKSLGVDHAIGVPARLCSPEEGNFKVVPVHIAAGVEPLISKRRCYELGKMIAEAVACFPSDEKVVAIGSGGISHHVGTKDMGKINSEFDKMVLSAIESGDAEALLSLDDDDILKTAGNGALEIRQFLCAMGVVGEGNGETILYDPWAGAVTGLGFAELRPAA